MKKYYPIMLDIKDKRCVVIGGGKVAQRKVETLLEYGAKVTVVSPRITEKLEKLVENELVNLERREYRRGDIQNYFLVYVATDIAEVNEACSKEAEEEGVLINVVDVPQLCDFIVPAVHRQGSLTLTVSTDGKSPMFSRKIMEELSERYDSKYKTVIDIMGEIRQKALMEIKDIDVRRELFYELVYGKTVDINDNINFSENMWKLYSLYRSREGCDIDENNKSRI